jgi:CRISPR system Cascade subunit CasA
MNENRFNLIDEPWIPVVDVGRVSLKEIFSNPNLKALGGNPVQKIALTKLLLAIAQSAHTPTDDQAWKKLGSEGLAKACLAYLDKWHDRFYLYGEQPFLQMPAIAKAAIQPFGAVLPEIATGNTTVHTQIQQEKDLDDADKALLVLQLMGFGLGGKKTDNTAVLTSGYSGKTKENGKGMTGKPGSSIGFMGFLHNFVQGQNLQASIWLNLFTQEHINQMRVFEAGLGQAPWEQMPRGEADEIAQKLSQSLMGRLIPLGRFVLLAERGLHYSEGIAHAGYKEGMSDPSVSVNYSGKDLKAIWVDTEKRPWRMLTALLSFMATQQKEVFTCAQLEFCLTRGAKQANQIAIWSGGLRVSSNAGEQYVSGSDDSLESTITLATEYLGAIWFEHLQAEMAELDSLAKTLYGCVLSYFKHQLVDGKNQAAQATNLFWQLCESRFQDLVNGSEDTEQRYALRKVFAGFVFQAFENYCPNETARQLDAWVQSRPNLSKYLAQPKHPQINESAPVHDAAQMKLI